MLCLALVVLLVGATFPAASHAQLGGPEPPKNPKAEAKDGAIRLTWNPVGDRAAEVVIYREVGGSGRYYDRIRAVSPNRTNRASYVDEDIESGKTYTYYFQSYSRSGEKGGYSKKVRASLNGENPSPVEPPKPKNLEASPSPTCIEVVWEVDDTELDLNNIEYKVDVYRKSEDRKGAKKIETVYNNISPFPDEDDNDIIDGDIEPNTEYTYYVSLKITSGAARGEVRNSETVTVKTQSPSDRDPVPARLKQGESPVRLMTWNVYLGASVNNILIAAYSNFDEVPGKVASALNEASEFEDTRAEPIAEAIVERQPHVVGLQEVAKIYEENPGYWLNQGGDGCGVNNNGSVQLDFLNAVMQRISEVACEKNRSQSDLHYYEYKVAAVYKNEPENADLQSALEFPDGDGGTARLVDRNVILVRSDVYHRNESEETFSTLLKTPVCVPRSDFCGQTKSVIGLCSTIAQGGSKITSQGLLKSIEEAAGDIKVSETAKTLFQFGPGQNTKTMAELVVDGFRGKGFLQPVRRGYARTTVNIGGRDYTIFNTHVELQTENVEKIRAVRQGLLNGTRGGTLQTYPARVTWDYVLNGVPDNDRPINNLQQQELINQANRASHSIILGDLNERYLTQHQDDGPPITGVKERWDNYHVVRVEKGTRDGEQIDHIIFGEAIPGAKNWEASTFNPERLNSTEKVSDHRGIYAEFIPPGPNQPPIARMNLPNTVRVGEPFTLDARPSDDPDGRIREYGWRIRPDGSNFGTNPDPVVKTGRTAEVTLSTQGKYVVELGVLDNDKATDKVTRTLTVAGTRDLTVNIAAPGRVTKNDAFTLRAEVEGGSDRVESYEWSVRHKQKDIEKEGAGATYELALNETGNYTVELSAKTKRGDVTTATQSLVVSPIDGPGVTVSIEGRNEVGKSETVTYVAEVDAAEGDLSDAEFNWRLDPERQGRTLTGSGRRFTVSPNQTGSHTISVTVTFPSGAAASDQMPVTVAPIEVNQAPKASIEIADGGRQVTKNESVTLSGASSTDPDGSVVTHRWSATEVETGNFVDSGSGERFDFETSEPGRYTIRLKVEDNDGKSDTTTTRIVVRPF